MSGPRPASSSPRPEVGQGVFGGERSEGGDETSSEADTLVDAEAVEAMEARSTAGGGGGKAKASKGKGRAPIVKGQPKPYKKRQGR